MDGQGCTAASKMDHVGLCSVFCGSLDERGVWGGMDTRMAESLMFT